MSAINTVVYVIHLLSVIGIFVLLFLQWNKSPRKLNPGVLHASLTALLAGIVLVGLHNSVKPDEELNHIKVGIKFIFLLIILVLAIQTLRSLNFQKMFG